MPAATLERSPGIIDQLPEGTFRVPFRIHRLQPKDISAYVRIMRAGIASLPFADSGQLEKRTEQYYRERINKEEWALLVARDERGAIAGVLEGEIAPNRFSASIQWIVTDPLKRKKGVAHDLYTHYETILREMGVQYMLATVDDANEASLNFHQKYGFFMKEPYKRLSNTSSLYYKDISGA